MATEHSAAGEHALFGLLAQFETPEQLIDAARRLREAGYRDIEAYSPFPVEGIDEALARPGTAVPKIAFICGALGAITAYALEYYCMAIGYPINIGGRPLNSWPSFMPIVFELTVLGASFGAFFGSMLLNGLPRPYHPLFNVPAFLAASQDRFFIAVEATDPLFQLDETRRLLEQLPVQGVFEVPE
jgi:hypothetical protein